MHQIGSKIWFKGDEATVTSLPYIAHGGEFQNAITDDGKEICVATPAHVANGVAKSKADWLDQQAQFRKLHAHA